MPCKILILNERLFPSAPGGVERRNHDLAVELGRRGHEVTLIGFGRGPSPPPPGVRSVSLGRVLVGALRVYDKVVDGTGCFTGLKGAFITLEDTCGVAQTGGCSSR